MLTLTAKDGGYLRFELLNDDQLQVFSQDLIDSADSTNTKNVVKLEVKRPAQIGVSTVFPNSETCSCSTVDVLHGIIYEGSSMPKVSQLLLVVDYFCSVYKRNMDCFKIGLKLKL